MFSSGIGVARSFGLPVYPTMALLMQVSTFLVLSLETGKADSESQAQAATYRTPKYHINTRIASPVLGLRTPRKDPCVHVVFGAPNLNVGPC